MMEPEEFRNTLSELMNDLSATADAADEGVKKLMTGATLTDIRMEVWDGDGMWDIYLTFSDGTTIAATVNNCSGPLASFAGMAGATEYDPDGERRPLT